MNEWRSYNRNIMVEQSLASSIKPFKCTGNLLDYEGFKQLVIQHVLPVIPEKFNKLPIRAAIKKKLFGKGDGPPEEQVIGAVADGFLDLVLRDAGQVQGLMNNALAKVLVRGEGGKSGVESINSAIEGIVQQISSFSTGNSPATIDRIRNSLYELPRILGRRLIGVETAGTSTPIKAQKGATLLTAFIGLMLKGKDGEANNKLKALEKSVLVDWLATGRGEGEGDIGGKLFIDIIVSDLMKAVAFSTTKKDIFDEAKRYATIIANQQGDAANDVKGMTSLLIWGLIKNEVSGMNDPIFKGAEQDERGVFTNPELSGAVQEITNRVVGKIEGSGICAIVTVYDNYEKRSGGFNVFDIMKTFPKLWKALKSLNPWVNKLMEALPSIIKKGKLEDVLGDPTKAKDLLASLGIPDEKLDEIILAIYDRQIKTSTMTA